MSIHRRENEGVSEEIRKEANSNKVSDEITLNVQEQKSPLSRRFVQRGLVVLMKKASESYTLDCSYLRPPFIKNLFVVAQDIVTRVTTARTPVSSFNTGLDVLELNLC